ncbi:MAG: macrolide ABC transporter ATP-binding protein [SAR202 cluster bacterium Io17-Chloro-G6]|nr:MAG: macrolide ABC transporter ATP-binding protein [SAR202 cluster bacterium Io17-Chloro-G6]
MTTLIELSGVTKVYAMGEVAVNAVAGVSMAVEPGELLSIVGPSGSGKSTLMNILGCLDVPTTGRYLLEGDDVGQLNDNQLAELRGHKIGFIFQTYNLLPRLSALANVQLPLLYGGGKEGRQRSIAALEKVGLGPRVHHRPNELSGGEQQRVGIARALVKNPSIILADEPTGNLDTQSGNDIMDILYQLQSDDGITVLIVTHDPEVAASTNRVVSMRDGFMVGDQTSEEYVRSLSVPMGRPR